jgi:hypothetical protein
MFSKKKFDLVRSLHLALRTPTSAKTSLNQALMEYLHPQNLSLSHHSPRIWMRNVARRRACCCRDDCLCMLTIKSPMAWSHCWASCPNGHLGDSDGDPPKILQRNPNSIPTHHNSLQISRVSSSPFTAELPFQHRPKRPGLSAGGSCEEAGSSAVLNAPIGRFEDFPPPRRSSFQEHGAPRSPSKLVVGGGASRQRSCAPPSTSTSLPLGVDDPSSSYAEVLRRGLRPPLPSRMSSCSPAASSRRRKVRFHSYTAVTSFQIGSPHVSWALASCGPLLGSFSPTSSQVSFQQLMPRRAFPIPDLPHNLPPDSLTSLAAEKGSSAVLPTASTAEDLVCSQQSHQCQEFPAQGVPSETPWLEVRRKECGGEERGIVLSPNHPPLPAVRT